MTIVYQLKDKKIDSLEYYETSDQFTYDIIISDNNYIAYHNDTRTSKNIKYNFKGAILFDLEIINKRKKQNRDGYQINGLTKEFINYLSTNFDITVDEIKGVINGKPIHIKQYSYLKSTKTPYQVS